MARRSNTFSSTVLVVSAVTGRSLFGTEGSNLSSRENSRTGVHHKRREQERVHDERRVASAHPHILQKEQNMTVAYGGLLESLAVAARGELTGIVIDS